MAIFDDFKLAWDGTDYVIPAARMLRTIARVEQIITLGELTRSIAADKPPLATLAMAYGCVLREAGAHITDEAVYDGMFGAGAALNQEMVLATITGLLMLMVPKSALAAADGGAAEANPPPRHRRRNSSSSSIRPPSAKAG